MSAWQRLILSQRYNNVNSWDLMLLNGTSIKFEFRAWNSTLDSSKSVDSVTSVSTNTWYHVCFVYTANVNISLFINGVNENTTTGLTGYGSNSDSETLKLGIFGADLTAPRYFNGTIDEVMIFNRSLDATEITNLYNNQ